MTANPRSRAPWGFVGAVVLVVAAEAAVARHDMDLTLDGNLDWRQARHAAVKRAAGCDVLCLGTSMVSQALFPAVIERGAGLRARNLAVYSGQACYSYYFLRLALASGARPSAVLVDFHPGFLGNDYDMHNGWSDILSARECLDAAWTTRDPRFLVYPLVDKALPSRYHRYSIGQKVRGALRGEPSFVRYHHLVYMRNRNRNQGSYVKGRNPGYRGEVAPLYKDLLISRPFRCTPAEERYIHRFLSLARAHGVRVYWVMMPMTFGLEYAREVAGRDAEYVRFVKGFQAQYPDVVVLDGRRTGYDYSVFLDACHLDAKGGAALTADIAEVLRRDLGRSRSRSRGQEQSPGGRWVALPAYRERPVDVRLESVAESTLAVGPPSLIWK